MHKRGLSDQVMVYALALIVISAISIVGWKMVNSTASSFCKTEINDFHQLLSNGAAGLKNGEVQEKSLEVPCSADAIYLFDSSNKPEGEVFSSNVRLKDAVESGAAKNVYIIKSGQVIFSSEIPSIEIPYPYFTCMIPNSGKIKFLLLGVGRGMVIEPSCLQKNCVILPERYDGERANKVIFQANSNGLGLEGTLVKSSSENFYSNAKVEREYNECNGLLQMKITITPTSSIGDFKYIETVPSCISSPSSTYENVQGFSPPNDLKMLQSNLQGSENVPIELSYNINTRLSDECLEQIMGIGFT